MNIKTMKEMHARLNTNKQASLAKSRRFYDAVRKAGG